MSIRIQSEVDRILRDGVTCRRCSEPCPCVLPLTRALVGVLTGIEKMTQDGLPVLAQAPQLVRGTLDSFAYEHGYRDDLVDDLCALAADIILEESRLD